MSTVVCSLCSGAGRATHCGKAKRAWRDGFRWNGTTWEAECSLCDFAKNTACPTCPKCRGGGVVEAEEAPAIQAR